MKRSLLALGLVLAAGFAATPAAAQLGGRVSVMPYVGYGFLGGLPGTDAELEADVAFGGRASYQLSPQFAVFGNFQRTTPEITNEDGEGSGRSINLDHWSAGVEFSYVPRGGAEGMLPILLEAGLGQARFENGPNEIAANIGVASAIQLTPMFGLRYGANDYIFNYDGEGVVNHVYVHVGGEFTF
ncbi:MAG TPA: hypothetical protein VF167_09720 [Longimicrobiaceae bacterium]